MDDKNIVFAGWFNVNQTYRYFAVFLTPRSTKGHYFKYVMFAL